MCRMKECEISSIVLGYDGSEGAGRAVPCALRLARQNNARVVVVTAFHGPDIAGKGEMEGRVNPEIGVARAAAEDIVLQLRSEGVDAEAGVLEGHASEALLRAAEAHHADLIVMGRRGHGPIAGLLLGSTSEYVVRRARVPVLVAH